MTDSLTAHASPSDTSFSPDWEEDRPVRQCYSFTDFRDGKVLRRADFGGQNVGMSFLNAASQC